MAILNKLVRDRTLEMIEKEDGACTYSILSEEEYNHELKRKLHDEAQKFAESGNVDELTDILELIFTLGKIHGVSEADLMMLRGEKRQRIGGFEQRLFLQEVSE